MKKAKRLLAVLLAAVMLFSAACIPSYAYGNWHNPSQGSDQKYYFTYEQGCTWVLDYLDEMLGEMNFMMTCDELNDLVDIGINIFTSNILLDLDDEIATFGGVKGELDLRSVDNLIVSIAALFSTLKENWALDALSTLLGDLQEDIEDKTGDINSSILRATNPDSEVLLNLVNFICDLAPLLQSVLTDGYDMGSLLPSLLDGMLEDLFPNLTTVTVDDIDGLVRDLLYTMLIDSSAGAAPAGQTIANIDSWVQQLINWALIDGTGTTAADGGFSMLGMNAEPMLPAMGDQPGGASLGSETISVDREGDGTYVTTTMSFYQLINNAINALMSGTVKDLVADLLYDALDVEITEEFPYGDPAVLQDETFNLIIGIVEGLMTSNGAPEPTYTDEQKEYPTLYIDALLDWLLVGGGLDTFLSIDYYGIHIQDNLMSLLNDVARLLISMLPTLGLVSESASSLGYSADELNEIWYLDAEGNFVSSYDETAVTQTYITYETEEIVYATAFETSADGVTTPTAYAYVADDTAVVLKDEAGNGDVNGDFIRSNYVITTDMVWANIIKQLLFEMIDGSYFPEWTEDIPSVLAYGLAALAAPVLPENNYYERLDAYHQVTEAGGVSMTVTTTDGSVVEALPYTVQKTISMKDMSGNVTGTKQVTVPYAALSIIASYAADWLNSSLQLSGKYLSTDVSFEQFLGEFLAWGFSTYMPVWVGNADASTGLFGAENTNRVFTDEVNTFFNAVYTNYQSRTLKDSPNWDAIYDMIDNTLFKLLPSSWLPEINGTAQLFNDWLFGNLIEFDIQGILGLITVNESGELNSSATQVIINVLDRILAIVFNDTGILYSAGSRTNVCTEGNTTTCTTLGQLLDMSNSNAGIPVLIYNLLTNLKKYAVPLLSTILPLVVSSDYQRPYDTEYLGTDMRKYGVADLEDYLATLSDNHNAYEVRTFDNEDDAYAAIDGQATAVKNADGSTTDVVLSNGTVYGNYASREEALAVITMLNDAYIVEETVDEVTTYTLWARISYLKSATATAATDDAGAYTAYSDFAYSQLTYRSSSNPFVSYDDDYYFFRLEDFGGSGFLYSNEDQFKEEADSYVSTYNSFVTNDLVNAYGEWYMYWLEGELQKKGLFDENGDGRVLTADTTEGDVTYYADGAPSIPGAMYPYLNTTASALPFTYFDSNKMHGGTTSNREVNGYYDSLTGTVCKDYDSTSFTTANFEQLELAVAYGADTANNVALSDEDIETVVRYILGTVEFDITYNADGKFNGSLQWSNMSTDQLNAIVNWCNTNGWTWEESTIIDGSVGYTLKRPAFKILGDNMTYGSLGVSSTPVTDASTVAEYIRQDMVGGQTDAQEVIIAIHQGYYDYVEALVANRRALYNHIDEVSYRIEQAENGRAAVADTTMLKWVLELTEDDYIDPQTRQRNYTYAKDENGDVIFDENGNPEEAKAFTTTSYNVFREAYDFGNAVYLAAEEGNILGAGITQSMITDAYEGILKAWQLLVEFTGFADWAQIDAYQAVAEEILADPYLEHEIFGVESGLEVLQTALADAIIYTSNKAQYDSEYQSEIDSAAAALNQAIQNLVYKSNPSINADPEAADSETQIQETTYTSSIQYAHIYGLVEGVGFGDYEDAEKALEALGLKISGITIDGTNGTVSITSSSRGNGTNARFDGRYQGSLRFRYFAVLYGDLNGDTRIDGTDAAALNYYLATNEATSAKMGEAKYEAADANHDGGVDAEDVQAIIDHYALAIDETTGEYITISQGKHSTATTA